MTSSYQSTAFNSSARPVDTFVEQPRVLPKTGAEELASILKTVNPNLQKFLSAKINEAVLEEESEGMALAIENAADGFKDVVKSVRKENGTEVANQLIGSSIFADRAYQKTKASILANTIESNYESKYSTTIIDGKPLSSYSFDSDVFQNWLSETRDDIVTSVGDIKPRYLNEDFLPKLANATGEITNHHIEQNRKYQLSLIKNEAVPLVKQIVLLSQDLDQKNTVKIDELIGNYEKVINSLGFDTEDRSSINSLILNQLTNEAENLVFSGNGDEDDAREIFNLALFFPYGPDGSSNLSLHPDFLKNKNESIKRITTFLNTQDVRAKQKALRLKDLDIDKNLKLYREALNNPEIDANKYLDYLNDTYPTDAVKFLNIAAALDGTSEQNYISIRTRIENGNFESSIEAKMAATSWINDPNTPKTAQNIKLYDELLDRINGVDTGLFRSMTPYTNGYSQFTKGILQNSDNISVGGFLIGKINQIQKLNAQEFTDAFRDFMIKNPNATQEQINKEDKRLRDIYLKKLKIETDKLQADSNYQPDIFGDTTESKANNTNIIPINEDMLNAFIDGNKVEKITIDGQEVYKHKESGKLYMINNSNTQSNNNNKKVINEMEGVDAESEFNKRNNIDFEAGTFSEGGFTTFEIESGDTLSAISDSFGIPMEAIMKANGITNANQIDIGDVLLIPEGVDYTDLNNINFIENLDKTKLITEQEHPYAPVREKHNFQVIYNIAKEIGIKYPELVAAQAMEETGWGSIQSAKNNFLGLKASLSEVARGESERKLTTEFRGKGEQVEEADFKTFNNIRAMMMQYKKQWNDDFGQYKGLVNANSIQEAIKMLQTEDYATNPDYDKNVLGIIDRAIREGWF